MPAVWGAVRGACDARAVAGQFILTGSATPADDLTRHSGALRVQRIALRTMSVAERGLSSEAVSLARLLDGEPCEGAPTGQGLPEAVDTLCRGGWPGLDAHLPVEDASRALRSYLQDIARTDIRQVDGVARDPVRVSNLLRSLARNVGTAASLNSSPLKLARLSPSAATRFVPTSIRWSGCMCSNPSGHGPLICVLDHRYS